MRKNLLFKLLLLATTLLAIECKSVCGQIIISGTVYDSSKLYVVPNVSVSSSSGLQTITDSLGAYHIQVSEKDSITFSFRGKSTVSFPVKTINDYNAFDISLRVKISTKYKLLQGVTVFSDTYHRDSIENRIEYSKIFNYEKPGISSTFEPGGAAGLDLDALINSFNKNKKRQDLAFKKRLMDDEQNKYVEYRFNPKLVRRITGLSGDTLKTFMKLYKPSYLFVISSSLTQFYQYILNASYAFKNEQGIK